MRQRQFFSTETQKLYGTIAQNGRITFSVPVQTHMQYIQVTDVQGRHIHSSVASSADPTKLQRWLASQCVFSVLSGPS